MKFFSFFLEWFIKVMAEKSLKLAHDYFFPPLMSDYCSVSDPAAQILTEASTARQLLPHAYHGVHPGQPVPSDLAHSPGPGSHQPCQRSALLSKN